jgi:proline iminopeptidase
MRILVRCFLCLFVVLIACSDKESAQKQNGYVEVRGGKIWYEIVGSEKTGAPILLLHGGPGMTSEYLRPLAALANERPVIFYDQLGSGKSDKPADTSLWKIERFVEELATLRKTLDLDTIHLFGHSWGTMLAMEYMARKPVGVKTLILAGPCISASKWIADANMLRSQLPQSIQDTLTFHEQNGTTNSPGYISATEEFYKRYLSNKPYTTEVQKSMDDLNVDVYRTMWGNTEFSATGNLKKFDRSDDLHNINIPALFTCGEFDEATPGTTAWYAMKVKNSEFRVIKDAAHMTMNEQPEEYVQTVRTFLTKNER